MSFESRFNQRSKMFPVYTCRQFRLNDENKFPPTTNTQCSVISQKQQANVEFAYQFTESRYGEAAESAERPPGEGSVRTLKHILQK